MVSVISEHGNDVDSVADRVVVGTHHLIIRVSLRRILIKEIVAQKVGPTGRSVDAGEKIVIVIACSDNELGLCRIQIGFQQFLHTRHFRFGLIVSFNQVACEQNRVEIAARQCFRRFQRILKEPI